MKYITIYTTINHWEISIIKNLFDEQEINYVIPEEVTSGSSGLAVFGMSGVRVQVLEHQRDKACALLKDRGFK